MEIMNLLIAGGGRLSYRGIGDNIGIYETIEGAVQPPHKLSTDYKIKETK